MKGLRFVLTELVRFPRRRGARRAMQCEGEEVRAVCHVTASGKQRRESKDICTEGLNINSSLFFLHSTRRNIH